MKVLIWSYYTVLGKNVELVQIVGYWKCQFSFSHFFKNNFLITKGRKFCAKKDSNLDKYKREDDKT